jgi:peptidoglycan/xylan/chitin deacetylase (PgdA/CDA1 family)
MSEYSDQWVSLSSEALRARRAELRRRRRRRRRWLGGLMALLLAAAAAGTVLLVSRSGAHAKVTRGHARHLAGHPGQRAVGPALAGTTFPALTPAQRAAIAAARENAAIDRLLTRQPFIAVGGPEKREIALTFDDGPGPYTDGVLDQLIRLQAPATFFEIGFMFQWFHAASARAIQLGEVIGDHTESHPKMARLSPGAQQQQILDQTQWVQKYGGTFPRLWRPPYGSYNSATLTVLRRVHMLMVLWTVDTDDYRRPGVATIVHRAVAGARPGAIILLHDAGGDRAQTIAALPLIVNALRQRGYHLVTVPQLILDDPPLTPQPLPARLAGD